MRIKEPEKRGECSKNKLAGETNAVGKYPLKDRICVFARWSLRLFSIFPIILRAQLLFHFRLLGEDRVHLIVQILYHNFSF